MTDLTSDPDRAPTPPAAQGGAPGALPDGTRNPSGSQASPDTAGARTGGGPPAGPSDGARTGHGDAGDASGGAPKRRRRFAWIGTLASLALFGASLVVLWHIVSDVDAAELRAAVATAGARQVGLAILLTT
jgi:hypothetical protein